MASVTKEQVIEYISQMSVLDLSELVKELEEKFGVSAAVATVAAPPAAGSAAAGESDEAKDSFNVILSEVGSQKINVIKEVRAITGLGLKEAKDLVEAAPKSLKENVSKEDAAEIQKKLEAVGAKVEVK